MPIYFAYGANMDVAGMATRCPHSRALGVGRLERHRLAVMPNGWGNVVPDPRSRVHGVLWDLAFADVRALDRFEDVGRGLYRKIVLPILKSGGGATRALVYVGRGDGGAPRPEYLETIVAAARHWRLPAPYIDEISRLGRPASSAAKERAKALR